MKFRAALVALVAAVFVLGGAGVASADEVAPVACDTNGVAHRVPTPERHRHVAIWFTARPLPASCVETAPVTWKVKWSGGLFTWRLTWQQHAGDAFRWHTDLGRGPHKVVVWRNGVRILVHRVGHRQWS